MHLSLAEKITYLRRKQKMSQRELAAKLGINYSNLPNYESGRYKPSVDILIKMADCFNVSLDSLVRDKDIGDALEIADRDLIDKLIAADKLNENSKNSLKQIIQSFLESQRLAA